MASNLLRYQPVSRPRYSEPRIAQESSHPRPIRRLHPECLSARRKHEAPEANLETMTALHKARQTLRFASTLAGLLGRHGGGLAQQSTRRILHGTWLMRYLLRRFLRFRVIAWRADRTSQPQGVDRCDVRYINLKNRTDRRENIELEFRHLDLEGATRVAASKRKNGALGCAISHVKALETPATAGKALMICEDDLEFLVPRAQLDKVIESFLSDPGLDVLCLAFNVSNPPTRISRCLALSPNVQTTACYVVKESARSHLLRTFSESVSELSAGSPASNSAIDMKWKSLQRGVLFFAVPARRVCRQGAFYSDIEKKFVDYGV